MGIRLNLTTVELMYMYQDFNLAFQGITEGQVFLIHIPHRQSGLGISVFV